MNKVIGVKFKDSGKIYYFDPLELEIEKGGNVIVETARGLVFGEVAEPPRIIAEESIVAPLKPVVRVATVCVFYAKSEDCNNHWKRNFNYEHASGLG